MWLCPVCHFIWGLGNSEEYASVFKMWMDRYWNFYTKGGWKVTSKEILAVNDSIKQITDDSTLARVALQLLGELAYHAAVLSETQVTVLACSKELASKMSASYISSVASSIEDDPEVDSGTGVE